MIYWDGAGASGPRALVEDCLRPSCPIERGIGGELTDLIAIRNSGNVNLARIDRAFPQLLQEREDGGAGNMWFRVWADIDALKLEWRVFRAEGQFAVLQHAESSGPVVRGYILVPKTRKTPFLLFPESLVLHCRQVYPGAFHAMEC